jgi:hypothetical protein
MDETQDGTASAADETTAKSADAAAEETKTSDADANTDSSDGGDDTETKVDIDTAGLAERLESVQASAAQKAEVEALRRQAGHIPGMQSRLDAIESAAKSGSPEVADMASRMDRLVTALEKGGIIEAADAADLRAQPADSSAALDDRLGAIEEAIKNPPAKDEDADDAPPDPRVAALQAGWEGADEQVKQFITDLGIEDPATFLPAETVQRIFEENMGSPANGAVAAMEEAQRLFDAGKRRAEKAEAAAGGDDGARTPQKGALTRDMMKRMTPQQLMEYPVEERDRALAAG